MMYMVRLVSRAGRVETRALWGCAGDCDCQCCDDELNAGWQRRRQRAGPASTRELPCAKKDEVNAGDGGGSHCQPPTLRTRGFFLARESSDHPGKARGTYLGELHAWAELTKLASCLPRAHQTTKLELPISYPNLNPPYPTRPSDITK